MSYNTPYSTVDVTLYGDSESTEISDYQDMYPRHDYENEDGTEGLNEGGDRTLTYARSGAEADATFKNILEAMEAEENMAQDRERGVVEVDSSDPQYSIDFNSMGTYEEEDRRREKENGHHHFSRMGRSIDPQISNSQPPVKREEKL